MNPSVPDDLILVDASDAIVGHDTKAACHAGPGKLHRAFSVFLFNASGEVLLQRRSAKKPLWPLFWSNACCSHPRRGESVEAAAQRRLGEELGCATSLRFLFKFLYQAPFGEAGSEHELCHVFEGRYDGETPFNPDEISELRWMKPEALDHELAKRPEHYTPWLRMEWERMRAG